MWIRKVEIKRKRDKRKKKIIEINSHNGQRFIEAQRLAPNIKESKDLLMKIVATFLLVTIILTFVIACTTLICAHFWKLSAPLSNCSLSRFEGANYLKPFCINCMEGYELI